MKRIGEPLLAIVVAVLWICVAVPIGYGQAQTPAPVRVTTFRPVESVFPARPVAANYATDCRIVRVIDGDTVEVEIRRSVHVRLLQCWAPESRTRDLQEKSRGMAAKNHLIDLVGEQDHARLLIPLTENIGDLMTLGRVLGYLWLEGDPISLSQHQVDGGFAVAIDPKGRH